MNKLKSNLSLPRPEKAPQKPLLVFDGECGFCRRLASKWYVKTGEQIDFVPYNEISDIYQHFSIAEFKKEIKLIYPEGKIYGGAAAAFKVIDHSDSPLRILSRIYNHTRAFDPFWEWFDKIVARNRDLLRLGTRG